MGTSSTPDAEDEGQAFLISRDAVEVVARFLYGETEYDDLPDNSQVKDAYRKRAKSLLRLAADATGQSDTAGPKL